MVRESWEGFEKMIVFELEKCGTFREHALLLEGPCDLNMRVRMAEHTLALASCWGGEKNCGPSLLWSHAPSGSALCLSSSRCAHVHSLWELVGAYQTSFILWPFLKPGVPS